MKNFKSKFTIFLTLSLTFLALSCTVQFKVKAAEQIKQIIFEEDFESYDVGTFPTSGGWELWYNGMGSEYQVIVDNVSSSPTKSFQLLGDYEWNWAAVAAKPIETDSPLIGFNASVRVESLRDGNRDIARLGFATLVPPKYTTYYAPILFTDYGTIKVGGEGDLQSYVADSWYKVTVIMDRNAETYSLWIDDVLVGENLTVRTNKGPMTAEETPWKMEAFAVSQHYHSATVYFDDIVVFSAFEADPKLKLEPPSGIATTTLVGSGFAPNSEISVTWNGTPVHTVPSPLITDGYGAFTAIISVLNQTVPGSYNVTVVDEMENEATAIFEVIPEVLSWTPLVLLFVASAVVLTVYKRKLRKPTNVENLR